MNQNCLMVAEISDALGVTVPLVAVVMALSIPILGNCLDFAKRKRLMELYHQQRMAAIDKGADMPPMPMDLLTASGRGRSSPLFKGLFWLLVGLALLVALYANDLGAKALYGLIPVGIGLAHLICYAVEGNQQARAQLTETKPPSGV
jgi:Domain of unknown function (DUF6249)